MAAALYAAYGLPMVAPTLKRPDQPIEPWSAEFWEYLSKTQNLHNLGGGPFTLRRRRGF